MAGAWVEGRTRDSETLILRICGELDLANRDVVQSTIAASIPTVCAVILDLGALTFCDSNGIAMLIAAQRNAEDTGTKLTLENVRPNVSRVLAIAGVDHMLNIADQPA